jgi:hypothetical protein
MSHLKNIVVCVLIAVLVSIAACKRGEHKPVPTGKRTLEVTFVTPEGETVRPPNIVASFSSPVVSITSIGRNNAHGPLRIAPEVAGSFHWLGTRTVSFVPAKPFPFATEFSVSIDPEVTDIDGNGLAAAKSWTFTTARPAIVSSMPADAAEGVDVQEPILLRFNQPVDPGALAKHLALSAVTEGGQAQRVAVKVSRPDEKQWAEETTPRDYAALVVPGARLPLGASMELSIDASFTGAEGALPAGKALTLAFTTYSTLAVEKVGCAEGCDPAAAITVELNNSVIPKDAVAGITIEPAVTLVNDAEWSSSWLELYGDFTPRTTYTVTLPADLTDIYGMRLGKSYQFTYATGDFAPSISLVTGNGVLEAKGPAEVAVTTRNVHTIKARYARLAPAEIVPLIGKDILSSNDKAMAMLSWAAEQDVAVGAKPNSVAIKPLTLAPGLADAKTGVVFLDVWSPEVFYEHKDGKEYTHFGALIQVTDIGITGKFSDDGVLVWTTSLSTGKPIANAAITVRGKDNGLLWEGMTDAQGLASAKFARSDDDAVYVFAQSNDDVAFAGSQWNNGFTPWDFGLWKSYDRSPLTAFLFTERGIYKPGETVHLKALVRRVTDDGVASVKGMKGTVRAKDERGREYFATDIELSDAGGANADIPIPRSVATGRSWIELALGEGKESRSFQTSVNVAAYKPAEFMVTMKPASESVVAGGEVKVNVTADYLFGEPMKDAGLSWSVFRGRDAFAPEGFDDYLFGADFPDADEQWKYYGFMELAGRTSGKLNNEGHAAIAVPTKVGTVPVITEYVVESTVTDINELTVSRRTGVTVHPGAFYIGMREPALIASAGAPIETAFISVDTNGKRVTGKSIEAKLLKREWHAVKKKAVVGFTYESTPEDVEVGTCAVTTGETPAPCTLTPASSGLHIVRATSRDEKGNAILTEGWFYVTGAGEAAWKPEAHDRMELVADKKAYAPGETATVLIKSPFERANALITYERGGVMHREATVLEGNAPEIKVPLTAESIPNVYVSVVMVAGRVGKEAPEWGADPGRPRVKVGYVNLPVSPNSKKLSVGVALDKTTASPGDEVGVTVAVKDADGRPAAGELTIMAVDTGSLILTDYKTPNPFDVFYAEKGLGVDTSDSRVYVIGRRHYGVKGEPVGGGGGEAGSGARTKFLTVAYWNPSLKTDASGKARITFALPDNLTTFKVMAVAATADQFGSGAAEVVSTKPFLMRSALPFFAAVGDTFKAGVVLTNRTKERLKGGITALAEGLMLKGNSEETFTLAPEEQKEVFFSYDAAKLGAAKLTFHATAGGVNDGLVLPIDVRVTQPKEVFASYGSSEASAKERFEVPKNVFEDFGGMDVSVASTAMVGLTDPALYLINYPYECVEQKISKALGSMIYDAIAGAYGERTTPAGAETSFVEDALGAIAEAQDWNGGVSFWPGLTSSPYLTIYAVQFMQAAIGQGMTIDREMFGRSVKYLHDMLRWNAKQKKMDEGALDALKAFALYALALAGEPEPAYQETLYAKREKLPLAAYAQLMLAIKQSNGQASQFSQFVKDVNKHMAITPGEAHVEQVNPATTSLVSSMYVDAYVLRALARIAPEHPLLPKIARYLLGHARGGFWVSTHTTAAVLGALYDYIEQNEREVPDFVATVRLGKRELLKATFEGRSANAGEKNIPMAELLAMPSPSDLLYDKQGAGRMYYRTRLTYASKEKPLPPLEEGFTILKTYERYGGGTAGRFKRGDVVRVKLSFVVPAARHYVVIDDGLPAGLEAVNFTLATAQQSLLADRKENFSIDHVEIYGDRVLVFADRLAAGSYEFEYMAKAATKGTFNVPPAHIEEMYNPEVFGRTATGAMEIE